MIDTNVVSELRKAKSGRSDPAVLAWAIAQPPSTLYLSAITVLELEKGICQVERRDSAQGAILRAWVEQDVLPSFIGRILPFDTVAARRCAPLHIPNPRSERDAMIAATALAHGFAVATRDISDFQGMGVRLVDPWSAS